ncbi:hypothetical protein BGX29_000819 [Mortierella sp. GBA35]|nr:hypothetical protein BGX29_000819 [Mortierella sp. GBA35]
MTPECNKALRRNKDYIRTIWYRAQRSDIVRLILSVPDLRLTELYIATREFKGKGLESVLGILEKFLRVLQMNTCPKEMEKCVLTLTTITRCLSRLWVLRIFNGNYRAYVPPHVLK